MAESNALQFKIQFIEDGTSLNKVIQTVTERLNNIKVSLGTKNFDISGIEQQLNKLATTIEGINKKFANVGEGGALKGLEGGAKNASNDMGRLADQLEKVLKVLESGNVKGFTKNIQEATNAAKALVEELSRLDTKFAKNIGLNIGRGMAREFDKQEKAAQKAAQAQEDASKKTAQSMGNTEAKTKALIASLNAVGQAAKVAGDAGRRMGEGFEFQHFKGLAVAKNEIEQINRILRDVDSQLIASRTLGFDTGLLKQQKEDLLFMKSVYEQIANGPHPGYMNVNGAFYSGLQVKDALAGEALKTATRNEVDAVKKASDAYARLMEMKTNLQSVPEKAFGLDGMGERIKSATAQIDKLMSEIKSAPDQMSKSAYVNQAFKALEKETNDILKMQAKAQQDAAREQERASKDVANAQKTVQKELDITKQKFNELYAAQTALRSKGFFSGVDVSKPLEANQQRLTSMLAQIRLMESMMNAAPQQLIGFSQSKQLTAWKQDFEAGIKTAKEGLKSVTDSLRVDNLLGRVFSRMQELDDLGRKAGDLGLSSVAQSAENAHAALRVVRDDLAAIKDAGKSTKGLGIDDYMRTGSYSRMMSEASKVRSETQRAINNEEQRLIKQNRQEATAEINRLKGLKKELGAMQAKNPEIKINGIERAIEDISRLIRLLEQAKAQGTSISRIQGIMGDYGAQRAPQLVAGLEQERQAAVAQHVQAQQAAAHAADQHAQAQQRMEQAIANATGKAQQQSQVLSDLRSMAAQYLSVWGASSFVKEIAQVTGELELQQRSLEVIIGSAGQAQEMFNNIKGLSQMSPYTFQDMLKSTRQLAAFGVETKDLYSTMKSLSDLGAGLDVDVQRLILAYGHVKSAGVLSGIQRRQFETAGINITGEIAKLYNQRYERAGSDERVTNADIFKKITKREIGFKDVEEAIQNLTGEGGKFYNMQLRQYETLGGKLRNLRNNYNIMLDDIGKRYMEVFAGGVDALNSMMENWRSWGALIKSVTAALVAAKVASLALGKSWSSMSAARNAARRMRYEAQAMAYTNRTGEIAPLGATAQAATRFNWKFWQGQQRTMLPPSYAPSVISAEGLNKFQKLRMALHKDVASFDRAWIAQQLGYSQQYQKHIAGLNGWRLGMERMKVTAQGFFSTMRAGFVSLATNPMMWIGAAIAGITALVNKANEIETAMEHSVENTKRIMREDIENIDSNLNPIKNSLYDDNGNFDKEALDKKGFQAIFEELDKIMQDHDPLYKGHLFDVKQMGDEASIIKGMIEDIEDSKTGKEMLEQNVGAIQTANADTGYNGSIFGNLGQWSTFTEKMHQADQDFQQFKSRLILDGEEIEATLKEKLPNVYKEWQDSGLKFEEFMTQMAFRTKDSNFINGDSEYIKAFSNNSSLDKFRSSFKDFVHDLDGAKNKVKDVAEAIAKGFDPSKGIGANIEYLDGAIENLFNTEDSVVKNPEMQEFFVNLVLANLPDDSIAPQIRERLYEVMMKANLSEAIKDAIKDGGVNPNNLDDNAIAEIESRFNNLANKLANSNPDKALRKQIRIIGDNVFKGFRANPEPAIREFNQAWKKIYTDVTDPNDPRKWITTHIGVDINAYTDETSFWVDINKKIAEIKKKLAAMKSVLPVSVTAKINIDAIVDTKSAQDAVIKAYNEVVNLMNSGKVKEAKELKTLADILYDIYKTFRAASMTGHRIHDDSSSNNKGGGGHKSDSGKKSGKGGKSKGGSGKDPEEEQWQADLKRIRDFINTAKEANSEYKKYRKTMNETAALQELIDNYKYWELIGPGKLLTEDDLRNIENFASIVKKAEAEIKKVEPRANKKGKPKRKEDLEELRRNAAKADSDVKMTLFNEESERQLASISTKLEDITRKWETFNKVLEKTGDEELASKLSGMSTLLGNANLWAVYHTGSALEDIDLGFMSAVDWKKIAGMSDESLEKEAVNILGEKETAAKVKALVEVFKSVKKAYNDLEKEIVNAVDTATSDAVDFASVEKRLEQGLLKITSLITASEALSSEEKALLTNRERAKKRHEKLTKSNDYARFESNAEGLSPAAFNRMYDKIRRDLLSLLDNRLINVDDFAKKIKDLRDKRSEYEIKQFSKITDLTLDGRLERNLAKALADEQKKFAAYEKANAEYEDTQIEYKRLTNIETQVADKRKEAKKLRDDAFWAKNRGEITKAELLTQKADRLEAEADALNIEAENAKAEIKNLNLKLPGLKAARDDAKEAADEAGKEVNKRQGQKDNESKSKATVSNVINSLNKFKEALDFVSGILDSFGLDAAFTEDTSSVIGGMVNGATTVDGIAKAFGAAGPWGAVAGAALGLAGQLAQIHDKNLQRRIDEIKEDTTKMNNTLESIRSLRERQLGYDNGDLRRALAAQYGVQNNLPKSTSIEDILAWYSAYAMKSSGSADSAMREYYTRYSNGSGYEQELELLKGQREKIMEMYDLENKKKKKSKEELENYKQQIADLDEQIMFFTEDLANNLWGIDLKGWADQLGDALMTAFENGTSAASAFKDSVQDIMRDVVKNMLTVGVVEPALEKLRVRLFGKDGNGGVFKGSQENIGAVLSELGNWFENEGPALMDAANEFYNGADNMMRQILGYGMRESEKSTSAVSSITSTASEETMGIVAGYLSRLSQDVSVQRIMQEMFVNGSWPDYVAQVTSANDSLSAIDRSTAAMMEMMRDGNGALYERVENMSRRLDNFANGIDTVTMR